MRKREVRSLNGLKFGISAKGRTVRLVISASNCSGRPGELVRIIVCLLKVGKSIMPIVRSSEKMNEKIRQVSRYWNHSPKAHDYSQIAASILQPFQGKHPAIVQPWFQDYAELVFKADLQYRLSKREKRHRWQMKVEKLLGRDLTKKQYRLVVA